jgi:murein DD-endopeptidase MepM/ murein hydrolase activator NlpD
MSAPALAVPSGVTFNSITPVDGTDLIVARTAANNPLDPPTFQLKADIFFDNSGCCSTDVTSVTISYPGSGIGSFTYTPQTFTDEVGEPFFIGRDCCTDLGDRRLPVYDGLDRDLPLPLPPTVVIDVYFDSDPTPLSLQFGLKLHDNATPLGAYFFPAKQSDLGAGQYWRFGTRHTVDAGGGGGILNPTGGSQRYALDADVVRWDGDSWTGIVEGGDYYINAHHLLWGRPLYAMADGTVISCYKGEADHLPADSFDDIRFDNLFGNSVVIQHGAETVAFAHMQNGWPSNELCPGGNGQHDDLSIPVAAGQQIGVVGNTGRSTGPHLHWQVNGDSAISGAPMNFLNVRALADETSVNNLGESPDLRPLHGMTLHRQSLVSPNPCGFDLPPAGALEVAKHGVSAECYQDVFNLIVSRGYRPVLVDGYDVDGDTFFNAVFRPAGPAWAARHGLDGAEYQALFSELTGDGFSLQHVDSYLENDEVRYAAVFTGLPRPGQSAFHGLDDAEFAAAFDDLADAGYVAVNVSTVEVGGDLYWTGLFELRPVTGWTVESVPAADYQDTFDANVAEGRLPVYVNGFTAGGDPYITGIWVDPVVGDWTAVHGYSAAEYQDAWDTATGSGLFTRSVTGYDGGGGTAAFAAVWHEPGPIADADGPYSTPEGTNVTLDASGTTDPDFEIASYLWDLDGDGDCDDASGAMPTFSAVGQDGLTTVKVCVANTFGFTDSDTASVTVTNVTPSVSLGSSSPDNEAATTTVTGSISDPGWLETLTATIDWGDGTSEEALVGTLENVRPNATFAFSANHVYGDNGQYTVTVTGADDDSEQEETVTITVNNLDPAVTIDLTDSVTFPDGTFLITEAGSPLTLMADGSDPGSDDLTFTWTTPESTTYFNNGVSPDPLPSPAGTFPFAMVDSSSQTWAIPGVESVGLLLADDDGGSDSDSVAVIVTGTSTDIRPSGWWKLQYSGKGNPQLDAATLAGYLEIVNAVSTVFSGPGEPAEQVSLATNSQAKAVLSPKGTDQRKYAQAELLTAWLNFASGSVDWDAIVPLSSDLTIGYLDLMFEAEAVILNMASTQAHLLDIRQRLAKVLQAS